MREPTFGILGPLAIRGRDGTAVAVGGPKPRAVLATLLLRPGAFVSLDTLTEVLWPRSTPQSAVANIRTYIRALRAALEAAGVESGRLRTCHGGYVLDVHPYDHDLLLFERRLERARKTGQPSAALRACLDALSLWRGRVLQDLPGSVLWDPALTRIEQLRAVAQDESLRLRLRIGDYGPLVAELRGRIAAEPLREDLWLLLVRALQGAGRIAEARVAYAGARRLLAAELGVAPGSALRAAGEALFSSRSCLSGSARGSRSR
ncbi:Transcriptional regulatory protein EmbR [Streptomyces sp. RB5]|uniref:Transcriptional regulatory protein EmbR n=1 Tax=Streptomyces smaragdinus TaxID=2585196 RepID=A0A7K0CJ54_9ACTN|nr:AfsR/SARP family transcriptional regulator [Streptomyces smaragdinus]MQY13515.1 Transcriptional regulatory protein EmbR [Streptomyces smaragdinus]